VGDHDTGAEESVPRSEMYLAEKERERERERERETAVKLIEFKFLLPPCHAHR